MGRSATRRRGPRAFRALPALVAGMLLSTCACKRASRTEEEWASARRAMVKEQVGARGIHDPAILRAMAKVPRHRFVPEAERAESYDDHPLPIGHGQTISQPYIVALMALLAGAEPGKRVLDVGTGSGYQAAVLAEVAGGPVRGIEIVPELAQRAVSTLEELGYGNVEIRCADGYFGWAERGPFDVIVVAAAADHVPVPLVAQLAPGGRMVIPVGSRWSQRLVVVEKLPDGTIHRTAGIAVQFVPMTGEVGGH